MVQASHFTVDTSGLQSLLFMQESISLLGTALMLEASQLLSFEQLTSAAAPQLQDGIDRVGFALPSGISLDAVLSDDLFRAQQAAEFEGEALLEMPWNIVSDLASDGIKVASYDVAAINSLVREEYVSR